MLAISDENCNAFWRDRCDLAACLIYAGVPFVFPLHAWIMSSVDLNDEKENDMLRKTSQRALTNLIARSSAIALIAAFMPLNANFTDDGVTISTSAAHAKGGGEGGQGGGGQGGGGQGGGGQGGGGQGGGNGGGGGAESAGGHGHGNGAENGVGPGAGRDHGATASGLGRGNAGHAADPAKENAAPHSAVGTAVAYGAAREAAAEAEADAQALSDALGLAEALGIAVDDDVDLVDVISDLEDEAMALDPATQQAQIDAINDAAAELQGLADEGSTTVGDAVGAVDPTDASTTEQSALEAAVKDATEAIGDALADLLGID
jgi:hypothetical protein